MRKQRRNVKTLYRLFKLKVIWREWKAGICRLGGTLDKELNSDKPNKVFCVKYSDFCKCEKCLWENEKRKNIIVGQKKKYKKEQATIYPEDSVPK
jgi:hypothetical protein